MAHRTRFGHVDPADVERLRAVSLFEGVDDSDLRRVASLAEQVQAEAGAMLIDQGDVGLECFVILEGTATISSRGDEVATVGPGTVVGEMALIGHRPRTAQVVAATDMELLAFDVKAFRSLLDELPAARERILGLLEARALANRDR